MAADSDAPPVELPAAEADEPTGVVTAELGVNVRTGPGTDYPIVGVAPQGTEGQIVGKSEDGQWWVAAAPSAPNEQGMGGSRLCRGDQRRRRARDSRAAFTGDAGGG